MSRHGDHPPQGELAEIRRRESMRKRARRERPPECSCPYDVIDGDELPCAECAKYGFDTAANDRPQDCDCPEVRIKSRGPRGEIEDMEQLPCWPCYRDGFDTPAHTRGGDDAT